MGTHRIEGIQGLAVNFAIKQVSENVMKGIRILPCHVQANDTSSQTLSLVRKC